MSEYSDEFPREFWLEIGKIILIFSFIAAVFVATYHATRITPEREAELKAQGAAAFDAKVEAAGGWDKWLAKELAEMRHE